MTEAKICCRDGEEKATIEFCDVRIEMGLTELRNLLGCAFMDIGNASGPVRGVLERPVSQLQTLVDCLMGIARSQTREEAAVNLKRYHETGMGGVTDMSQIDKLIGDLREGKVGKRTARPGTIREVAELHEVF